jgi:hypothetical protein
MNDINYQLRVSYKTALDSTGIPSYYQEAPPNVKHDQYIIFRSISGRDESAKCGADVKTSVTVEIHTRQSVVNSGSLADLAADLVFGAIYPDKSNRIQVVGADVLATEMTMDETIDWKVNGGEKWISRYITFQHYINIL